MARPERVIDGSEAAALEATIEACLTKVTRLTVVPPDDTAMEWRSVDLDISLQDDCRTLKIFLRKRKGK